MSYNKIILIGHLGRDPELRYTPSGKAVCDFSLATTEKANGQERTTWFKVTVWGQRAELLGQYVSKGSQVYVEGRLGLDEYTDREGGKRVSLTVNANEIQFLERRPERSESQLAREAQAPLPSHQAQEHLPLNDDDIPF